MSTDGYVELRLSPAEVKALTLALCYCGQSTTLGAVLERLIRARKGAA